MLFRLQTLHRVILTSTMNKATGNNFLRCSIILILATHFSIGQIDASGRLENDYLQVNVSQTGAITFFDKQNNETWGSDFVGWVELSDERIKEKISLINTHVTLIRDGQRLTILFKGISGDQIKDENFEMHVTLQLEEKHFEIEIEKLQTSFFLENIEYPAHLLTVKSGIENGYMVVPHLQGIMIPSRYDAGFMRYGQNIWDRITDIERWWSLESGNLNMPWFGASHNQSSVMAYIMTSSDCILHLIGNSVVGGEGFTVNARQGQTPGVRISSLTPIWLSSMKKFAYPRKIRIELVDNGYVGMATRYKEYAKASGRYVTLKEKIKRYPEYEKIIGAPDIKIYCYTNRINNPYLKAWSEPVLNGYSKVNTTFDQVAEIADELKRMDVDKCMILLGGWNRMGYDREHVDMWPPAEKAGGIEGLRTACEVVKEKGYLFALHDNYDDFYPDAPSYDESYILRDADGSIHQGGVWDGGLCHIICPVRRNELLERNLGLIQGSIPLNGYYFDVLTSTSHYECYDERHKATRKEDLNYRLAMLNYLHERGLVVGGERGTDWAIPELAFCEGLSGGGTGYHYGISYREGLTIPLFYLVYRECVVGYWQHGTPYGREDHANHVLLDLLYGQPSSWSIVYDQWEDLKSMIKETYDLLGRFHEKTAHYAMNDHHILTVDHMVQKSEFSDGTRVWVNFGITSYQNDEFSLPPKGFRLQITGEPVRMGRVDRNITYMDN